MLRAIQDFFERHLRADEQAGEAQGEQALRLATAALLVEVTRADFEVDGQERAAVRQALEDLFGLGAQALDELVRLAEQEADEATSLFQFTRLIDRQFPYPRKVAVVERLWQVAFADARKDSHEEHLVRKVADLLHVSHTDFIRARHKAEGTG
jgi:uncharacterized tellurite resistance protein B-like protein